MQRPGVLKRGIHVRPDRNSILRADSTIRNSRVSHILSGDHHCALRDISRRWKACGLGEEGYHYRRTSIILVAQSSRQRRHWASFQQSFIGLPVSAQTGGYYSAFAGCHYGPLIKLPSGAWNRPLPRKPDSWAWRCSDGQGRGRACTSSPRHGGDRTQVRRSGFSPPINGCQTPQRLRGKSSMACSYPSIAEGHSSIPLRTASAHMDGSGHLAVALSFGGIWRIGICSTNRDIAAVSHGVLDGDVDGAYCYAVQIAIR